MHWRRKSRQSKSFLSRISDVLAEPRFIDHPFCIFTFHYFFHWSLFMRYGSVHIALLLYEVPFLFGDFQGIHYLETK